MSPRRPHPDHARRNRGHGAEPSGDHGSGRAAHNQARRRLVERPGAPRRPAERRARRRARRFSPRSVRALRGREADQLGAEPVPASPYAEQRLTPEGVEQVRTALLGTGMFTSTATDPAGDPRCNCVRADDGRLLGGPIGPGTDDTLAASIATLLGSLPESAWVQQQPKPFVARSVTVCVGAYVRLGDKSFGVPRAPAELMPRLPGRAPVLFAGRELVAVPSSVINEMRDNLNCYEMTMDEARGLAEQLLGPSVGGTHAYWGIALRDPRLDALTADPTDQVVAYVSFYGKMPDWAPNW